MIAGFTLSILGAEGPMEYAVASVGDDRDVVGCAEHLDLAVGRDLEKACYSPWRACFAKNPGERERRLTSPPADRGLVGRPR